LVIVKLIGGLGNQLFQYAAARRVACVNGVPLKLDISGFEKYTLRRYSLHHFDIAAHIARPDDIAQIKKRGPAAFALRFTEMIRPYHRRHLIIERTLDFDPGILRLSGNVYLQGYWGSERYFKDIEPLIRKELAIRTAPSAPNAAMAERIGQVSAVSIHIRRGDKVSDPSARKYFPALPLEYYRTAIDRVAQNIERPHFFVFSDNAEWARENLHSKHPLTFVAHNGPDQDFEDLRLMSLCQHHIIANSTFSWWGAWLGVNMDRIVIAPRRWLDFSGCDTRNLLRAMIAPRRWLDYATYDARDLFPDGWTRI
jgi:hypothetical protein